MEGMKCNNLLYIPIRGLFIIVDYTKKIDLNCLSGYQYYTKCLWNSGSIYQIFQNVITLAY